MLQEIRVKLEFCFSADCELSRQKLRLLLWQKAEEMMNDPQIQDAKVFVAKFAEEKDTYGPGAFITWAHLYDAPKAAYAEPAQEHPDLVKAYTEMLLSKANTKSYVEVTSKDPTIPKKYLNCIEETINENVGKFIDCGPIDPTMQKYLEFTKEQLDWITKKSLEKEPT